MCGICGYYHLDTQFKIPPEMLDEMNKTLAHRGPDSQGRYLNGNLGMAMRRLAIIDISGGDQPVTNEDETVIVLFNGEIYNFRDLRGELESYGHLFSTESDTEVIAHAYEQWGDKALEHFNGMFAVSIWDVARRRLLLARDRIGKKPLYWLYNHQSLLWGSEIKAILAIPWVEQRINPIALHHYLTLEYIPDPLSIYEGIYQLPAAHKLVVEENGKPEITRWWELSYLPKHDIAQPDIIEHTRYLLKKAVERRLISEVPLGAFLSGGIDSSIIVALMSVISQDSVKTFTINFDKRAYSEAKYARIVADHYKTEHYEFLFKPNNLVELSEQVIAAMDEPFADPAALPLFELAKQAKQHVTVALCGDGGDETLAGYRLYQYDTLLCYYNLLPEWVTGELVPNLLNRFADICRSFDGGKSYYRLKRLSQLTRITRRAPQVLWRTNYSHQEKIDIYTQEFYNACCEFDTYEFILENYYSAIATSLMDRTLYTDLATYLPGDLLAKTDRMTMAHSLECRAPFLDLEWLEWSARLPERYKVRGMTTKWLLKRAFKDFLPPGIEKRGKHGFRVPIGFWLKNDLSDWARSRLLANTKLEKWIRPDAIQKLLSEHFEGKVDNAMRIWLLLMLAIWLDHHQ